MKTKIAIQGFEGSYSNQAVKNIFNKNNLDFELIENNTFSEAFLSIKKYGLGLIPVENSTAGFVEHTIDELIKNNLIIIGEYFLDIEHNLLGLKDSKLSDIKKVYSHKQALAQTSNFLKKRKILTFDIGDTAGGADFVIKKKQNENGAIGSKVLADIYGLKILKNKINNENENTTRFFLISTKKNINFIKKIKTNNEDRVVVTFETENKPASLYNVLGLFVKQNINLTKILSHPVSGRKFKYLFYVEFQNNNTDLKLFLNDFKNKVQGVKLLGIHKKIL